VRDGYIEAGMPPGVVEVVPNGVDLERYTPEGRRRELPEAGTTFLFVGGSIWRKGVDLLLEAWAEAFGPDDDLQLVVKDFGTTSHYRRQNCGEEIRRLAEDGQCAPIVYLDDDLSPDEIAELYRAADVMVTPYRGEGFCMPALEAMACGLPVIHNGVGPTREFVPNDAGWALPAERTPLPDTSKLPELAGPGYVHEVDFDALVAALRAAAADPADREARGLRARAAAEGYSWDAVAQIAERSLATLAEEALPRISSRASASSCTRQTGATSSPGRLSCPRGRTRSGPTTPSRSRCVCPTTPTPPRSRRASSARWNRPGTARRAFPTWRYASPARRRLHLSWPPLTQSSSMARTTLRSSRAALARWRRSHPAHY
jgi:hypothetical protein